LDKKDAMTREEVEVSSEVAGGEMMRIPEESETSSFAISVAHERLQVSKRQVLKSKVKVHKTVEEHLETVNLPLQRESVEIVRVPKDEIVTEASGSRREGDTLILPIYEEVLVVEKRLRLVEEVHVKTKTIWHHDVREVLLRQEKVKLERDGKKLEVGEIIP
jgi:uncharacterized protein (TIGR02271 family)